MATFNPPFANNANKTKQYVADSFAKNANKTVPTPLPTLAKNTNQYVSNSFSNNQMGVNAKAPSIGPSMDGGMSTIPKSQTMSPTPSSNGKNVSSMSTASAQKALGISADGVYGPQTTSAVKTYQTKNGLTADGILGPQTMAKLQGGSGSSSSSSSQQGSSTYQAPTDQYQPDQYQQYQQQSQQQTQPQQPTEQEISQNQQLINRLQQMGNTSSAEYKAATDKANSYNDALLKSKMNEAKGLSDNASNPIPIEFQQGRGRILQDQYGREQVALGSAYNAATAQQGMANTQQGMQQGAVTAGISATQPQMQFGMLTNPQTGEIIGGAGSNAQQLMGTSLMKAQQMFANGATFEDAIAQSGLSQFGNLGSSLLSSAIMSGAGGANGGAGYNPTAYNTQVGANQQNLANTQTEAFKVSQNLQQVKALESVMLNYLQKSGVNPSQAQIYNGPINDYLSKIGNPGAAANWALQMGDLKNYTSQLIASGYGGTPTGAEASIIAQDPSKLSYKDLKAYLQTLEGLGGNRLNVLQQGVGQLGGNNAGYSGNQAYQVNSVPVPAASTGAPGTGITSQAGQFAAGIGANTLPGLAGSVGQGAALGVGNKLISTFLNFLK